MAFALIIKDNDDNIILEHVANYSDDTVNVPNAAELGLDLHEYRKSYHLLDEIEEKKLPFKIITKNFDVSSLF